MAKADLQEEAARLGVAFTTRTTVEELEELIAAAGPQEKFASDEQPGDTPEEERELMLKGHQEQHLQRLKEEALAAENRAKNQARVEGKL